mgnify:CR=1 FL=1
MKIMDRLNAAVDEWRAKHNMGFALYGTPAESLTHRFSSLDRARFGIIEDITDKGYYTNSYHVSVREEINVFDKFSFESEFQKKSTGGCISYAEIPNMTNNIPAVLTMIQYIYDEMHGKTQSINDDVFSLLVAKYKEEQSTSRLAFKLPTKLLEDFKAVTPNQSKTLRLLLIEYIYKHQQQQQ